MPRSKPGALPLGYAPVTLCWLSQSARLRGDSSTPRATMQRHRAGAWLAICSASECAEKAAKMHPPVPVRLALVYCDNHAMASSTSGKSRRATGSQSLWPPCLRKAANVMGCVLRVKYLSLKMWAVDTVTPGSMIRYQLWGSFTGRSDSPTPSPQALSPRIKTGTSAPS